MAKIKIGKIPVYKGEYDNNTIYNRLNQVTYLGTTFLSIVDDNLGHPPAEKSEDGGEILYINTNYWDIIAKGIDNVEERTATDNSMGYKILKKNKSFAEQVIEENTIYDIRYDFTLTGDITIPNNCVLKFDGGSISGEHTIIGTNTSIQAILVKIFNTNVTLAGLWNVTEAYPEWFGAKGDGVTDDSGAINKSLFFKRIVLDSNKCYGIASSITLNTSMSIRSCDNNYPNHIDPDNIQNATIKVINAIDKAIIITGNCNRISGLIIECNDLANIGIYADGNNRSRLYFENLYIAHFTSTGVDIATYLSELTNVTCRGRYGYVSGEDTVGFKLGRTSGNTSLTAIRCYADRCKQGYIIKNYTYSSFINCCYDNGEEAFILQDCVGIGFYNCGTEKCNLGFHLYSETTGITIDGYSCSLHADGKVIYEESVKGNVTIKNLMIDGGARHLLDSVISVSSSVIFHEIDSSVNLLGCDNIVALRNATNIFETKTLTWTVYPDIVTKYADLSVKKIKNGLFGFPPYNIDTRFISKYASFTLDAGTYLFRANDIVNMNSRVKFWVSKADWINQMLFTNNVPTVFTLEEQTTLYFGVDIYANTQINEGFIISPYLTKLN